VWLDFVLSLERVSPSWQICSVRILEHFRYGIAKDKADIPVSVRVLDFLISDLLKVWNVFGAVQVIRWIKFIGRFFLSQPRSLFVKSTRITLYFFVGFLVLTTVVMKSSVFWNITRCSPLKFSRRFGGTCRLRNVGQLSTDEAITLRIACLLWQLFWSCAEYNYNEDRNREMANLHLWIENKYYQSLVDKCSTSSAEDYVFALASVEVTSKPETVWLGYLDDCGMHRELMIKKVKLPF
jgi:hypothetical protein